MTYRNFPPPLLNLVLARQASDTSRLRAMSLTALYRRFIFTVHLFVSELSVNTAAFAKSAAMLGNSEDHTALSRALSQLAEVEEKIDQLHQEQAFADFYVFSELLSDYIRLIGAVKVSPHLNLYKCSYIGTPHLMTFL